MPSRASAVWDTIRPPMEPQRIYRRHRAAVLALVVLFGAVLGMLGYSYAETREAHGWVTQALELESHVMALRVWVGRETGAFLSQLAGNAAGEDLRPGDRMRARAELEQIRALFGAQPAQAARVDELERLLERRFDVERRAEEATRTGGLPAANAVLAEAGWTSEGVRIRSVTSAMLQEAGDEYHRRDARYDVVIRRVAVALAAALVLLVGTFLYLVGQVRAALAAREEAVRANALARERLSDLEGVLDTVPAAVIITRDRDGARAEGNAYARTWMRLAGGGNVSLSAPVEERPRGFQMARDGVPLAPEELPLQVAARTGEPVENFPMEMRFDDGQVLHMLGRAHPLRGPAGDVRGAVAAFVDVTVPVQVAHELKAALEENRRLLAAARRSELLHREMTRNFPGGAIGLYDHDLRFLVFGGTRLATPRPAEETVGRTLAEVVPADVYPRLEEAHREALQGRTGRAVVVINGRTVQIVTHPVRDETGAVIMGLAFSQDVTEEISLRTQLAVSSRLASLGTLVAGVAHEVNNPLAGTIGSIATAVDETRDLAARLRGGAPLDREALAAAADEVVEMLLDAQAGGNRIARIVKDLALFGKPNPMRTRIRLGDVVTSSMRWLPAAVERAATVNVDDLGAPEVHASAGQLEQVVVNLVTNAANAIPDGRRGNISVRVLPTPSGGAALEVQDDGAGIDAATLERIFDPFFTTREVGRGMGLGLPICHAIVTAHGGRLTVTSRLGVGSTFRIELPAAPAAA